MSVPPFNIPFQSATSNVYAKTRSPYPDINFSVACHYPWRSCGGCGRSSQQDESIARLPAADAGIRQ
jgi:hypothetical protein